MKISRKPTPPRPTAPSRPSRLVTADMALARAKISGMGLVGPTGYPSCLREDRQRREISGTGSGRITTATPVSSAGCATPSNAMAATAVSYPELSRNRTSPEPVARTTARHASVSPPVLTTQPAPESAVATECTSRCSRAGAE
jgi:hypothetical protein